MNYFVVKYIGPFGFIKPWTAVRDSKTFSQQFLTASIVEGIEKKIFPFNFCYQFFFGREVQAVFSGKELFVSVEDRIFNYRFFFFAA